MSRLGHLLRVLAAGAGGVCKGVALGAALAVCLPYALHGRAFVVMSGSMEPAVHTGDVVIVQRIAAATARVGDVITFRDPDGTGRLITHRVRSVQRRGGSVDVVTKGDAANGVQRWSAPADGSLGRVRFRLWKLGYALGLVRGRAFHLLLVIAPAVALAALALGRIWRGRSTRPVGVS